MMSESVREGIVILDICSNRVVDVPIVIEIDNVPVLFFSSDRGKVYLELGLPKKSGDETVWYLIMHKSSPYMEGAEMSVSDGIHELRYNNHSLLEWTESIDGTFVISKIDLSSFHIPITGAKDSLHVHGSEFSGNTIRRFRVAFSFDRKEKSVRVAVN